MLESFTIDKVPSLLASAREQSGLSLREVARRVGTSHTTLSAYERGQKTPSVATFIRIVEACGFAVDIELSRRIREANGLDRGEELKQVLELAEQYPAQPAKDPNFPKFGQRD